MIDDLIKQRKELGISVRRFSKIIGYSMNWVYQVERGERRISKHFVNAYDDGIKKIKKILDLF